MFFCRSWERFCGEDRGQMRQTNAAGSFYERSEGGGVYQNVAPGSDAGEAATARWLQSAGLQHLASPTAVGGIEHRHIPNIHMQVVLIIMNGI